MSLGTQNEEVEYGFFEHQAHIIGKFNFFFLCLLMYVYPLTWRDRALPGSQEEY